MPLPKLFTARTSPFSGSSEAQLRLPSTDFVEMGAFAAQGEDDDDFEDLCTAVREIGRRCGDDDTLAEHVATLMNRAHAHGRIQAEARLARTTDDPNAVHVNMLRGSIAMPSIEQIVHLYGEDALRAALDAKRRTA